VRCCVGVSRARLADPRAGSDTEIHTTIGERNSLPTREAPNEKVVV